MKQEDLYDAGLIAIQKKINELNQNQISISPLQVCNLINIAIEYGAPTYNQGSPEKCAKLYCKAAKGLTDLLHKEQTKLFGKFRFLCEKITNVISEYSYIDSENAADIAWDLRDTFDAILIEHFSTWAVSAIDTIDRAFNSLFQPSILISLAQIQWILALTISEGAPIYDEGYHKDCAMVYLHSARRLNDLLKSYSQENIDKTHYLSFSQIAVAGCLSDFSSLIENPDKKYMWALKNRPKELSWDLRKAFDSILALEYNPSSPAASKNSISSTNQSGTGDIDSIVGLTHEDISFGDIQRLLEIITGLDEYADEGRRGWRLLLQASNLADFGNSLDYLGGSRNEVAKRLVVDLLIAKQLYRLVHFIKDLRRLPPKQREFLEGNIEKFLTSSDNV